MQLLQYTASMPKGSGQCNSRNALPHCLGAVGDGTPAMHGPTAREPESSGTLELYGLTTWGQWALEHLQHTASLPGGSGRVEGGGGAPAGVPWTMGFGVVPGGSRADQPGESSVLSPQEQDGFRRTLEDALSSRQSRSERHRTTTLRSDLPPGPWHQPSESPESTRVSVPRIVQPVKAWVSPVHHPRFMLAPGLRERGPVRLCALPAGSVPPASRVQSRDTIMRTAGGLGTPGFCECGTCVTAIAPRWCIAAEVSDDARPQRPSPNDEPYDTCTKAARDRESGTTTVPEPVTDVIGGVGVPPSPLAPPVLTRRHNTRHKKTRSQIEPHRVPGGKQDNARQCKPLHTATNSFFLFLGSPPGFLFRLAPLFCCFPRMCHFCRWCRPLDRCLKSGPGDQSSCTRNDSNTHSAHSQSNCCGTTGCTAPFLSTCRGRNTRRITLIFHFLSTHDGTMTKSVGRMQQTNRQSSEPTENTLSVDTASHLYDVHAMDG